MPLINLATINVAALLIVIPAYAHGIIFCVETDSVGFSKNEEGVIRQQRMITTRFTLKRQGELLHMKIATGQRPEYVLTCSAQNSILTCHDQLRFLTMNADTGDFAFADLTRTKHPEFPYQWTTYGTCEDF